MPDIGILAASLFQPWSLESSSMQPTNDCTLFLQKQICKIPQKFPTKWKFLQNGVVLDSGDQITRVGLGRDTKKWTWALLKIHNNAGMWKDVAIGIHSQFDSQSPEQTLAILFSIELNDETFQYLGLLDIQKVCGDVHRSWRHWKWRCCESIWPDVILPQTRRITLHLSACGGFTIPGTQVQKSGIVLLLRLRRSCSPTASWPEELNQQYPNISVIFYPE